MPDSSIFPTPTGPTNDEIARSWSLWMDYIDPGANMTEEEFDAMTVNERIAFMEQCFGPEETRHYAVADDQAVWGIGRTIDEAFADARDWIDRNTFNDPDGYTLECIEITQREHEDLSDDTGWTGSDEQCGILDRPAIETRPATSLVDDTDPHGTQRR